MLIKGSTYLVTVSAWFTAPNGQAYNTVFGTLREIGKDYIELGSMHLKRSLVLTACRSNCYSRKPYKHELVTEEGVTYSNIQTRIFDADKELKTVNYSESFKDDSCFQSRIDSS